MSDIRDPTDFEDLAQIREAIERHPCARPDWQQKRAELHRFLVGPMAEWKASTWPLHWVQVRKGLRELPDTDDEVTYLFNRIYTAMCRRSEDELQDWIRERADDVGPSRSEVARWVKDVTPAVLILRSVVRPERLLDFDAIPFRSAQFDDPAGRLHTQVFRLGHLARPEQLRPGSGRHRSYDTAREMVMRLLTKVLGVGPHPAASAVSDVLLWFLGERVPADTLRKWWLSRTPR